MGDEGGVGLERHRRVIVSKGSEGEALVHVHPALRKTYQLTVHVNLEASGFLAWEKTFCYEYGTYS